MYTFTYTHPHTHVHRTYNIQGISFTPAELVEEMRKYFPHMKVTYEPDERQDIGVSHSSHTHTHTSRVMSKSGHGPILGRTFIPFSNPSSGISGLPLTHTHTHTHTADSWPEVLDDSNARAHWNWSHDYNLERMVAEMVQKLTGKSTLQ